MGNESSTEPATSGIIKLNFDEKLQAQLTTSRVNVIVFLRISCGTWLVCCLSRYLTNPFLQKNQVEKKKESRADASQLSMSVLQDRGRQTPKPVLEVLDEDAHTNETRSVVTVLRLGQRTRSSKATIQQAKLKPHRIRLKTKSCPVKPTEKHHAGAAIEAAEVDNDVDGDTMEKQRRQILLLWEYSTLGKVHFDFIF